MTHKIKTGESVLGLGLEMKPDSLTILRISDILLNEEDKLIVMAICILDFSHIDGYNVPDANVSSRMLWAYRNSRADFVALYGAKM